MGATTFTTLSYAKTAEAAFSFAVSEAEHWYGHNGHTGTIAEKTSFIMIGECASTQEAYKKAEELIDNEDPRIDDKYGPAGCIKITEHPNTDAWLFFGWACS